MFAHFINASWAFIEEEISFVSLGRSCHHIQLHSSSQRRKKAYLKFSSEAAAAPTHISSGSPGATVAQNEQLPVRKNM